MRPDRAREDVVVTIVGAVVLILMALIAGALPHAAH